MQSFFDIEFLHWSYSAQCHAWIDKQFDYYVLDYANSGSLTLIDSNEQPIKIDRPTAWVTYPGPQFKFGKQAHEPGTWEHYYVAFRGALAEELVNRGLFVKDVRTYSIQDSLRFKNSFDNLFSYLKDTRFGMNRAALMLEDLLLQLHEQQIFENHEQIHPRIKQLVEKVRQHPEYQWNFRVEAKKAGFSFSHFRKLFTDGLGIPPTLFLIGERMKLAANLLRKQELELVDVSVLCGYDDIYYFNKSFKKYHGITPGKFKKQVASFI